MTDDDIIELPKLEQPIVDIDGDKVTAGQNPTSETKDERVSPMFAKPSVNDGDDDDEDKVEMIPASTVLAATPDKKYNAYHKRIERESQNAETNAKKQTICQRLHDLYCESLEPDDNGKLKQGAKYCESPHSMKSLGLIRQIGSVLLEIDRLSKEKQNRIQMITDKTTANSITRSYFRNSLDDCRDTQGNEISDDLLPAKKSKSSHVLSLTSALSVADSIFPSNTPNTTTATTNTTTITTLTTSPPMNFFIQVSPTETGVLHHMLSCTELTPWIHVGELPVADMVFVVNNRVLFAIERKTVYDYQERYTDWKSQRVRLHDTLCDHPTRPVHKTHVNLLIEYSHVETVKQSLATLEMTCATNRLAWHINTIQSNGILHTVLIILAHVQAILKRSIHLNDCTNLITFDHMRSEIHASLLSHVVEAKRDLNKILEPNKKEKKDDKGKGRPSFYMRKQKLMMQAQLMLFSGVSEGMADAISSKWSSPTILCKALKNHMNRKKIPTIKGAASLLIGLEYVTNTSNRKKVISTSKKTVSDEEDKNTNGKLTTLDSPKSVSVRRTPRIGRIIAERITEFYLRDNDNETNETNETKSKKRRRSRSRSTDSNRGNKRQRKKSKQTVRGRSKTRKASPSRSSSSSRSRTLSSSSSRSPSKSVRRSSGYCASRSSSSDANSPKSRSRSHKRSRYRRRSESRSESRSSSTDSQGSRPRKIKKNISAKRRLVRSSRSNSRSRTPSRSKHPTNKDSRQTRSRTPSKSRSNSRSR